MMSDAEAAQLRALAKMQLEAAKAERLDDDDDEEEEAAAAGVRALVSSAPSSAVDAFTAGATATVRGRVLDQRCPR